MSSQLSIFTKGIALVLVLVMLVSFVSPVIASGSNPCADEEDDYFDELKELGVLGVAALAACSPASLATVGGAVLCGAALTLFLLQRAEVDEAWADWKACERENDQN